MFFLFPFLQKKMCFSEIHKIGYKNNYKLYFLVLINYIFIIKNLTKVTKIVYQENVKLREKEKKNKLKINLKFIIIISFDTLEFV